MRFGSLFSGIGGLDLGLERAGMQCAWQVENEPYCLKVLAKHWPDVARYEDIREVDFGKVEPVELLAGGFPCQDLSYAGKGAGLSGERSGLWGEFVRAIRLARPRYILVENVPGLLSRGMGVVLGDLCALGYDAEWESIPAAAFGAPHLRWRVFIVAYSGGDGWLKLSSRRYAAELGQAANSTRREGESQATVSSDCRPLIPRRADTSESRSNHSRDRKSAYVAHPEQVGWRGLPDTTGRDDAHGQEAGWEEGAGGLEQRGEDVPNSQRPNGRGLQRTDNKPRHDKEIPRDGNYPERTNSDWWSVEPDVGGGPDGLSSRLDGGGVDANAKEARPGAVLRDVRRADDASPVQRALGRYESVYPPQVLQPSMYGSGLCQRCAVTQGFVPLEGAEDALGLLRTLWGDGEPSRPPCRREAREQLAREYPDVVRQLSHHASPPCSTCWVNGSWEDGLTRVAQKVPSRVDRLRGLGNAVVPQKAEWLGRLILEHEAA